LIGYVEVAVTQVVADSELVFAQASQNASC